MNLELIKETLAIRTFSLFKIPMLFFLAPSVVELNDERVTIKIKLSKRTKNHLGSMYFGVLCAGADVAGGALAYRLLEKQGVKVKLAFKEFKADFLKRAEDDVHFVCNEAQKIREMVDKVMQSEERLNEWVKVSAYCPKLDQEPVAEFELLLSLKRG